uniref:Uncharacterized protein n=1 Tax=Oryza nivara TaxID=4536 RepID=A0A0E0IDW7_ORYNI
MWSPDCRLELQHRRPPSTAPPLTPTSSSIRVAGRCALRRRPNSVAGPLRLAPSSPAVDPAASPGLHPIHLLLRGSKETRWGEKNLLTWLWLAVEYHLIPLKYHLICGRIAWIPGRYQDLIHRKHHPQCGKNRMIPDRYHPIPRKYHLICGRNARSCDPPRISFVKPDDTRHDTNEDHDTSQVSHDPPKVSPMKPGETGHDTKEDHDTSQISCDSTTYQISDDSYHVSGDTREVSCDSYHVSCDFYDVSGVILMRYHIHMIPTRYQELGVEVSRHRRRRPRPPPSTLHTEPEPHHRQPHPPLSTVSELVAGDRVLRRELVTGGRVCRPRLSRWLRPPHRSSSPVPPPPPRRILRRPRPTPELVDGAVSVTTQDSPPFMRPCPTSELVGGRVLHAGARRRQPRPPRWSSAAAAASAPPASTSSALLPWGPALSHLREVDWERSCWDSIPTGYRYIAAPK